MRTRVTRTPGRLTFLVACTLAVAVAMLAGCTSAEPPRRSTDRTSASADLGARLRAAVDTVLDEDWSRGYQTVRAILVSVDGNVKAERYRGVAPTATSPVASVTTAILATLIGVAIGQGRIAGTDQTIAQLLPGEADAMSPATGAVTLRQLLTMTAGFSADATGLPADVVASRDWVRAILSHGPQTPGPYPFAYSVGTAHLLSAVLREATGQTPVDYARSHLFGPLRVDSTESRPLLAEGADRAAFDTTTGFAWLTDPGGNQLGSGGLRLRARDLLAIGQLWLDDGVWLGRRLVPPGWLAEARTAHVATGQRRPTGFGYQLWVTTAGGLPAFAAVGAGGQLVEVVPRLRLAVVVQASSPQVSTLTPPPRLGPVGSPEQTFVSFVDTVVAPIVAG